MGAHPLDAMRPLMRIAIGARILFDIRTRIATTVDNPVTSVRIAIRRITTGITHQVAAAISSRVFFGIAAGINRRITIVTLLIRPGISARVAFARIRTGVEGILSATRISPAVRVATGDDSTHPN
jgi:hypothetical protein